MSDDHIDLIRLLQQLPLFPNERGAFLRSDTQAILEQVRILTAAAIYFNAVAVRDFGGRLGAIRSCGLVDQAIGAAFQSYGGVDPHPAPFEKAAMLLRGITQGHPFNDGNKRTGFIIAARYLDLVGHPLPLRLPVDDVVELCLHVSAGLLRDVEEITARLERLWAEA